MHTHTNTQTKKLVELIKDFSTNVGYKIEKSCISMLVMSDLKIKLRK